MDKFIYSAAVKELQLCKIATKLENFVRLYASGLQRTKIYSPWNGVNSEKEANICYYKLLTLALKLHSQKSRKVLPDFIHKIKNNSHKHLLEAILGFDSDSRKALILTELISYDTFLDWFEFDDLLTIPNGMNYIENLNKIVEDRPFRFEIIFNNLLTLFDLNSTKLMQTTQQLIYAIRHKQVNFPDKPQTIWDRFIKYTTAQAQDITQHECDREVLKLEQQITAIKSFRKYYDKQ